MLLDEDAEGSLPPSALRDAEQVLWHIVQIIIRPLALFVLYLQLLMSHLQALAVDFAALAESLDQLPLYQLLSVEDELLQPQKQAEATMDAANLAHEREEPAHTSVEDYAVPMHQEQLAAAQQRLQTVGSDAEGTSPQKADFLDATLLAQPRSHQEKESTSEAAPETELDELLGMCNAEAPSHADIDIARTQVGGTGGKPSSKMLHQNPKTTAIACKPNDDERDLEHWLNSV